MQDETGRPSTLGPRVMWALVLAAFVALSVAFVAGDAGHPSSNVSVPSISERVSPVTETLEITDPTQPEIVASGFGEVRTGAMLGAGCALLIICCALLVRGRLLWRTPSAALVDLPPRMERQRPPSSKSPRSASLLALSISRT